MDSNKPLCLLNTQINYRLGNQNCNLFLPPLSVDALQLGVDEKQTNLCLRVQI